jgi:soluble lytic murein transglycosylase
VWLKFGNERFSTLELRYIQTLSKEETFNDEAFSKNLSPQAHKEYIITNLIKLLNNQKKFVSSFKIFQDSLDSNSLSLNYKIIKFIFPLNYFDLIKKNAENLDPLIIISLIRQESAFNPEAQSRVGAKGLMQLMPATAKQFNRRVKTRNLVNPEVNVAIGTKYLRQLISRYDGNLIFALASYNAGENRIDRWRKEIFRSNDPLSTIESIPFEETRNYVKLIYRNNFFYSLLTNKPVLNIPIEESFKVTLNKN